jgi:glycosyltransferase involved in cell wall biosynthesis
LGLKLNPALYYVVPDANWVTDWVGRYVVTAVSNQFGWPAKVTSVPHLLVNHIIHYGETGAFLASLGSRHNRENTLIATMFHGNLSPEFPQLAQNTEKFLANTSQLTRVVTACHIMENRLLDWGVPAEKVVRLPLGVDLDKFHPVDERQRRVYRQKMGIPQDAFCIGSFQKDGVGWGQGLTPKTVKGPDVFLEVVAHVSQRQKNIFVLLTGPARGYVKHELDRLGISYQHHEFENYHDVVTMYHCLDAYLITSREEGGPKAILESLACGVPLVSTRVGMALDVIEHGVNGLMVDVEDVAGLVEAVSHLMEHRELGQRLAKKGLADIQAYDWQHIAARYYTELYEPVLASL